MLEEYNSLILRSLHVQKLRYRSIDHAENTNLSAMVENYSSVILKYLVCRWNMNINAEVRFLS